MTELFNKKMKRKRDKPTHRWTDEQTLVLLQGVATMVKEEPEGFEKPTSQKFYNKIIEKETILKPITWVCAKNKMRNLRAIYVSANTWRNNTGSGLMENEKDSVIHSHILKICPHYELLKDVYGHKQSVIPTYKNEYIIVKSEPAEEEQSEEILDKPINEDQSESSSSIGFNRIKTPIKRLKPEGQRRLRREKMYHMRKLFEIQEKRIKIEMDRLEFEKEKEKNNTDLRKMELENERLRIESEERIKKLELQLKYKNSI